MVVARKIHVSVDALPTEEGRPLALQNGPVEVKGEGADHRDRHIAQTKSSEKVDFSSRVLEVETEARAALASADRSPLSARVLVQPALRGWSQDHPG